MALVLARMGTKGKYGSRAGASNVRAFQAALVLGGLGLVAACSTSRTIESPPPVATASSRIAVQATSASTSAPIAIAASASASAAPVASAEPVAPEGMKLVPGGTFTMGSDDTGEMDERPAHKVTLAAFFLDVTEVTNEAYGKCVAAGVCTAPDPKSAQANKLGDDKQFRGPKQPVSSIPWDEAKKYCEWMGRRLPTEAEFERAARDDDGRTYAWGNEEPTKDRAVYGASVTSDVGSKPDGAGPYGHLDLAGNVWEWIADEYDPYAYRREGASKGIPGTCAEITKTQDELRRAHMQGFTGTNPIPTECEHVLRGGAFNYHAKGLRASNRVHHPGRFHLVMSGVRCAKSVE